MEELGNKRQLSCTFPYRVKSHREKNECIRRRRRDSASLEVSAFSVSAMKERLNVKGVSTHDHTPESDRERKRERGEQDCIPILYSTFSLLL